jgi:hypothetical protein
MSPELQATLARLDAVCAEVSQMASAIADQLREARKKKNMGLLWFSRH